MSFYRPDVLTLLGALTALAGPPGALAAATSPAPPGDRGATQPAAVPAAEVAGQEATAPARTIACTLSSAEKRERRAALQRQLLPRVVAVTEIANGYVLWFDRAEGELERLASFVELESQCCAFLDFAIRVDSGGDRIALQLDGPEGTKEFLKPLVER